MEKFGVGQAVRRREDERFLTGAGCYLDDLTFDNMCHAAMVRSPHAHARILSLKTEEAKAAPGVIAVFAAEDYMQAGYGRIPTLTAIDGLDEHGVRHPERHANAAGGRPVISAWGRAQNSASAWAHVYLAMSSDGP